VSPEQIGGEAVDTRSDLYSFGVLLFEMIAGRLPFVDPDRPLRVLQMHMTETPKPLSQIAKQPVPGWLDDLVAKLLAKYPDDRPPSADRVLTLLESQGRSSTPAPAHERPKSVLAPQSSSWGAAVIGGVVLVIALSFGLGGLLFGVLLAK
jgi:serine/threonine-protein kinase